MKKFLSIYLIFLFQLLFGQNNYPTIHLINPNELTFNNLAVDANGIYINTNVACARNDQNDYKGYYYFKAENNIDLNLTVKANNTSNPDFKLFVWKIIDEDSNDYPNELFINNQTINANRSIYGGQIEKGLFETEAENHNCEFYNGDGKVRGLISNDIVRKNEIVVIAFMTTNQSDTFDLTLNIAESRTITSFSNLCHGESYTYDQIIDEIQNNSGLSDIQLYRNNSFNENDRINAGEIFTSDTTIYAQVRDQNGVLKYIYTIPLRFVPKPTLNNNISDTTCEGVYKIDFVNISNKLGINLSDYDLLVKKDGVSISNGAEFSIASNLEFKVSIKSKTEGNCESNVIDFMVTKTQKAAIREDVEINDYCVNDYNFTPTLVGAAVNRIQNGNSYTLKYYKADGSEFTMDQIYDYMKETLVGKVIVKALSGDNEGICNTEVELRFNINASTFERVDNIAPLLSHCLEVNSTYTFGKSQIEAYLRTQLSGNIEEFYGFGDVELDLTNPIKEITFKVRLAGETCWSDEMKLKLQLISKPNVREATEELKADCDDSIVINESTLISLFGENAVIDFDYEVQNYTTPLIFDESGKTIFKVIFRNKLDNNCFVEKEIIINKSIPLPIKDASINVCIEALDTDLIEDKIEEIRNETNASLKFYFNNQEIAQSAIEGIIRSNLNGIIIVEANNGCTIRKHLKFDIIPGFNSSNVIDPLLKDCYLKNSAYTFNKSEIENYLRSQYNNQNLEFDGIVDTTVLPNSSQRITYRVKETNGCWSAFSTLELKLSNIPYYSDEEDLVKYCEGDQIMFDYNYLKGIFGDEIENYSVKINDREIGFSETLNFGSSTTKNYSLTITNPSTGCSATVNLVIKKKNEITEDLQNRPPYTITFCEGDKQINIEQKIQAIIDEINDENQFTTELTPTQIYDKYVAGSSNLVEVDFENNDYCGVLKVTFEFEKLDVPIINIPEIDPVCSVYYFDIKEIDGYEKFDFILKDHQGNSIPDTNFTYDLPIGHYDLEVRFKGSQCMSEFPIEIKAAAKPIIEKIVISNNQIIVQAKGEGKLEYSFDGDEYNLINKRTLNEDQLNKPITVSVRLNDCEVTVIVYVLKVPQVFTPNGDQYNNQWAEGLADKTTEYHIQIFDRYGKIIYENQGAGVLKWDGTKNGKQIPTDTYWYLIKPLKADTMLQVQYSGSILVKQKK